MLSVQSKLWVSLMLVSSLGNVSYSLISIVDDPAMTYRLEIQSDHLLHLCVTWQSKTAPILCAKALPSSWGPTETQLQHATIYEVMAGWGTAGQSAQHTGTPYGEFNDDFGAESYGLVDDLVGELFTSVKATDLTGVYHDASDLSHYLDDVHLAARDLQTTK